MVGKRTLAAYEKMLNIPRVRLADPRIEARALINGADLVAVVTGSVALEAVILGKPVLTFGDCPYNLLPQRMLRRCADPRHLPQLINDLLGTYASDETALENYIAAVMDTSVRIHLYSVLLKKRNVHTERETAYQDEIAKLAAFLLERYGGGPQPALEGTGAAGW
jgi:hypothetical protein